MCKRKPCKSANVQRFSFAHALTMIGCCICKDTAHLLWYDISWILKQRIASLRSLSFATLTPPCYVQVYHQILIFYILIRHLECILSTACKQAVDKIQFFFLNSISNWLWVNISSHDVGFDKLVPLLPPQIKPVLPTVVSELVVATVDTDNLPRHLSFLLMYV